MPAPNSISAEKLARLIGTPGAPTLIDLRREATHLIPGSVPRPAVDRSWIEEASSNAVVIDDDGSSTAIGVAALLRAAGTAAEILDGGYAAWAKAKLPRVDPTHLPPRQRNGGTLWVTRARPKVDRIACPWLIRRFIDPEARFLFVPAAEVLSVATRFGAEPFDIEGDEVFWSHRGDRCTFDTMLEAFGISGFEPLAHLAHIVRGADTGRPQLVPEAAGLLAISLGLSRAFTDDLEQLEAGMTVYDAVYRWARDARSETHDWASHTPARPPVSA